MPEGRVYRTPDGTFPSVTTVLGKVPDDDPTWREEWIAKVGQEEADRVLGSAGSRGSEVHKIAEAYVTGEEWQKGFMPVNVSAFRKLQPLIDARVGTVRGLEFPLWSRRLRTAGRTDLVCDWNNIPSIVDFKTARRRKSRESIWKYFVQAAAYAIMYRLRTGLNIENTVVAVIPDDGHPLVYVEKVSDWVGKVADVYMTQRPAFTLTLPSGESVS